MMHILDQMMWWGMAFLGWYAIYVLVAGSAFAGYLLYRVWLQPALRARSRRHRSLHRRAH